MEKIEEDRDLTTLLLTMDFTDALTVLLARLIPKSIIPVDYGEILKSIKEYEFEKLYDGLFFLISNLEKVELNRLNKINERVYEITRNTLP